MAARLYLTVYAANDLNGVSLGTVNEASEVEYKHELHGTGAGMVKIARHHTQAALLVRDRYVRVHSDQGIIGGFFLEDGTISLSDANGKGGEFITWTGRGPMAILERAVMDMDSNVTNGQDPIEGFWDLSAQGDFAGASNGHPIPMMKRALNEANLNSPNGIAVVNHSSWTYDLDSAGVTPPFWGSIVFGVDVGEDLLTIAGRMSQLGDVYWVMSHDFVLRAYLSYGTNKAGAFGAGTVRFEKGVNIADSIDRKVRGSVDRTHLIVGGAERTFVTVTDPDYISGDTVRWGFLSVNETADTAALTAAGLANIEARKRQTDSWSFPQHDHGNVPASGIYEPGNHYWVGDIVTLHTGTGSYDANAEPVPVASITWQLKTGDDANGDYWVIPEVGSTFNWAPGPGYTAPPGSQIVPCVCPTAPTPATDPALFVDWTWTENPSAGVYQQTVAAYPEISQPSGTMNAGITIPGQEGSYYRSGVSGNALPIFTTGGNKYLPCTQGVAISFSALIGNRGAPSGTATLEIRWYSDLASTLISTNTLHAATIPGPIPNTTITSTLTPPTGAIAWTIFIIGTITNVTASSGGSGASTPAGLTQDEIGTDSGRYADATHNHIHGKLLELNDPSDHPFFVNHAANTAIHSPANLSATTAPTVNDDSDDGWAVGSKWVDTTNDNVYIATDVTVGAANWAQVNGGGSSGIPATLLDAKGDLIVASAADTAARLGAGANGTVLTADSAEALGVKWGTALTNPMTAAGDIIIGGAAGAATRLPAGTNGHVLTLASGSPSWAAAGGGGSGTSWTQDVNQSGASFAAYTVSGGTWASDGTIITQTATALSVARAYIATAYPMGFGAIAEVEVRFPTAGAGTGTPRRGGVYLHTTGTGTGGVVIYLTESANQLTADTESVSALGAFTHTVAKDTWYKVRGVYSNGQLSGWVDGVLIGTWRVVQTGSHLGSFFGLFTYGTKVDFRNHKSWTLSGGAPA